MAMYYSLCCLQMKHMALRMSVCAVRMRWAALMQSVRWLRVAMEGHTHLVSLVNQGWTSSTYLLITCVLLCSLQELES